MWVPKYGAGHGLFQGKDLVLVISVQKAPATTPNRTPGSKKDFKESTLPAPETHVIVITSFWQRNETETNLGGGGSSPSPAQLREPATPPLGTSSFPQTPALAPLVDPLFHWGGGRDAGIQPALVPRQTNALGVLEEGWREDGIESHR